MGAQEGKLLGRKGKSTVKVSLNLTEADYKVFQQFQTYVIKKHGKLRGVIGHELAKALKQYLKRNQKSPQTPQQEVTEAKEKTSTSTEPNSPKAISYDLVIEVGGKRFRLKEHEWRFIKEDIVEKTTSPNAMVLLLKSPKTFLPLLQAMIGANAICYDAREGRCKINENAIKITHFK